MGLKEEPLSIYSTTSDSDEAEAMLPTMLVGISQHISVLILNAEVGY